LVATECRCRVVFVESEAGFLETLSRCKSPDVQVVRVRTNGRRGLGGERQGGRLCTILFQIFLEVIPKNLDNLDLFNNG